MNDQFSKIRSFLWPIHRHELPKFLPIVFLFFLISFNYHLLKIFYSAYSYTPIILEVSKGSIQDSTLGG